RRLEQEHRRIDPDAEKGAGAEIHIAGIAAENAPGHRQHDELQDHVACEEPIFVGDELRRQQQEAEKQHGCAPESDISAFHDRLPNRPCGRTSRMPSSSAKEIAGAQDAPNIVSTMVSATPRMIAAISVPVMLPSPAITTTQKVRPI